MIISRAATKEYLTNWDAIFGKKEQKEKEDWRSGLSILAMKAVQKTAQEYGKTPQEVIVIPELWKPNLYQIN